MRRPFFRKRLKVKDVMTTDIAKVSPNTTLQQAAKKMEEYRIGNVLVVESTKLLGIVTEMDMVRKAVAKNKNAKTKVKEIMASPVIYVSPDDELLHTSDKMLMNNITRIPVVNLEKKGAIEETAAKNLVQSIFELRRKKILNIASLSYKTEKIPENLEENEKRLYLNIIKLLRENFERKTIISSENKSPQNKKEVKKPEEIQNLEDKKTRLTKTRVMFLVDIPEIFLPSGNSCSFKRGEEKEIDLKVAKVLEEKGFCRLV